MQFLQLTIIKFKRNARKGFPQSCNGFQIRAIFVATLLSNMLLKVCLYRIIIHVDRVPVSLSGIFGTRDSYSKYLVHDGALTNKRV